MSWHVIKCHHVKLKDISCHEMSWNVTKYHHVSWNVTMLNWNTWYLVKWGKVPSWLIMLDTFHDISWHMVIFHDKTCRLSWYVMTCHGKSWNDSIWFREEALLQNTKKLKIFWSTELQLVLSIVCFVCEPCIVDPNRHHMCRKRNFMEIMLDYKSKMCNTRAYIGPSNEFQYFWSKFM